MISYVVVVGVNDDEEGVAIGVIIAMACFGRVRFVRERIRYVKVVLVPCRHAIMVTNAGSFRQIAQGCCREIAGVFRFLFEDLSRGLVFSRFVDLVARGNEEIDFRMLC